MAKSEEKTFRERRDGLVKKAGRLVVKVGSGVLTGEKYTGVDEAVIAEIARQVAELVRQGRKIAVVSSGSVAIGSSVIKIGRRGMSIPVKQAAAALGQGDLISLWSRHFASEGFRVGQALLTHDDLSNRRRFLNARDTINALFDLGVIPVINENDTVAVHEIKFGDNDTLAARVTNLVEAGLLAILSDVDGLYTADPRKAKDASMIDYVEKVDEAIMAVAGDSSTRTGLGGMASKVRAAAEAARFGAGTVILPGAKRGALLDFMKGESAGTFFFPLERRLSSKKHWIEFTLKAKGRIHVDQGAMEAVMKRGKSLLALGIRKVEGEFDSGEAVELCGQDGKTFAKGLSNYNSSEIALIMGKHSREIEAVLGYKVYDEIIHRDDMVFL
ncbi:MAG: glutamate 5-kinase [Candidatus Nitrospinota bacterium M3_3B_026]